MATTTDGMLRSEDDVRGVRPHNPTSRKCVNKYAKRK
jgi:hypothetical protein